MLHIHALRRNNIHSANSQQRYCNGRAAMATSSWTPKKGSCAPRTRESQPTKEPSTNFVLNVVQRSWNSRKKKIPKKEPQNVPKLAQVSRVRHSLPIAATLPQRKSSHREPSYLIAKGAMSIRFRKVEHGALNNKSKMRKKPGERKWESVLVD